MTQLEAFPATRLEAAELFLRHFDDLVKLRLKSVISANDKLTEAQQLRDLAERQLQDMKDAENAPAVVFPPLPLEQPEYGSVAQEAASVDPVTGEVAAPLSASVTTNVGVPCPDCSGEGRLPDKTGGGRHKCRACDGRGDITKTVTLPAVGVFWPGDDYPTTVTVGPLTRFGELAADYLASLPADDQRREDDVRDYLIFSSDNGGEVDQGAIIASVDYGHAFVVERQEG